MQLISFHFNFSINFGGLPIQIDGVRRSSSPYLRSVVSSAPISLEVCFCLALRVFRIPCGCTLLCWDDCRLDSFSLVDFATHRGASLKGDGMLDGSDVFGVMGMVAWAFAATCRAFFDAFLLYCLMIPLGFPGCVAVALIVLREASAFPPDLRRVRLHSENEPRSPQDHHRTYTTVATHEALLLRPKSLAASRRSHRQP
jgi:hypothetical protein